MRVRVASAGTGKTTSLVLRYLELIAAGTPLRRIAGVTYTRAAASELRQRVGTALTELLATGGYLGLATLDEERRPAFEEALRELPGAAMTTIHGFMARALRLNAVSMGLDPDFTVLSEWEAGVIFAEEARSLLHLASADGHHLHESARIAGPRASALLAELFGRRSAVREFQADDDPLSAAITRLFAEAYRRFGARTRPHSLGPGEIEREALRLPAVPGAGERVCSRHRVLLVDEFQDVNPLQAAFFARLEELGAQVEVVGDPKQAIYGFRSADVECFRRERAAGEELPPLVESRRHSDLLNRFLNLMTRTMAARGMGFESDEAPQTKSARPDAAHGSVVELHWLAGDEPLAELREREAEILAERLRVLHLERGVPYGKMAVLARSHRSLALAQRALQAASIPAELGRGKGFYTRSEVRDLYNALRAAVDPSGTAFLAFLRGPFGALPAHLVAEVMAAEDKPAVLARLAPEASRTYGRLQRIGLLEPLAALKSVIREPLAGGRSILAALDRRQRENVDALLFELAQHPPDELELLLERLETLAHQAEAGDVPQSGEGISLLTVHAAKGLEWDAVALFDVGRGSPPDRDGLEVDPHSGRVTLPGGPGHEALKQLQASREAAESHRLLYVAASRAHDILIVTGSIGRNRVQGWIEDFEAMGVGPSAATRSTSQFILERHSYRPPVHRRPAVSGRELPAREYWTDVSFPPHPLPPLVGPSRLLLSASLVAASGSPVAGEADHPDVAAARGRSSSGGGQPDQEAGAEPLPRGSVLAGESLPGRASAIGTLVHYAISQDWRHDDPEQMANLAAQEVMFPFTPQEAEEMLAEVGELLAGYWALLGGALPSLEERERDEAELPMAIPMGTTVLQGVIDRLYLVGGRYYVDDYKSDRQTRPERYLHQLAVYTRALEEARGIAAEARLVYLRSGQVVTLDRERLEQAYAELEVNSSRSMA